jgi:predicted nucleotidyltransferase
MMPMPLLKKQVEQHPYPLIFGTISGAHLYGFPSPDSDFDLRGVHVLPLHEVVGLQIRAETIEKSGIHDGIEIDLVTHDAKKFFGLLLKKNGYVLEQVLSPLVVHTTPEHAELKEIAAQCVTRHHAHHYLGFAQTQWKLFEKENPPRVKPLLYVYRVLLTGIHLMQAGEVEANLVRLNDAARLPYLDELIERKVAGAEKERLTEADLDFHRGEYVRLREKLQQAHEASDLPESPRRSAALNDLLVRLRLSEKRSDRVTP